MELNIENEQENKLFERKEILANATYKNKTPTRQEVKQELCKKKNLDPEMVEIVSIDQEYGQKRCTVTAYAYLTAEAKARGAFKLSAKKKEAIAKAAEQPAKKEEAKQEEAKAEEPKAEEAKQEAKPEEKAEEKQEEKKEEKKEEKPEEKAEGAE